MHLQFRVFKNPTVAVPFGWVEAYEQTAAASSPKHVQMKRSARLVGSMPPEVLWNEAVNATCNDGLLIVQQDEYKSEAGTVIAADFYHSNTLMPLSDAEIVQKVKSNLDQCEPSFRTAKVHTSFTCMHAHREYLVVYLNVGRCNSLFLG